MRACTARSSTRPAEARAHRVQASAYTAMLARPMGRTTRHGEHGGMARVSAGSERTAMTRTRLLALPLALAVAAPLMGLSLPAAAQVDVDLVLRVPPPAPRVEPVPPPRPGHVWAPGYWAWRGNQHVWVAGSFQPVRAGHVYQQPRWVQRDGQWVFTAGRWARHDKDGDGVNNAWDRDRDGDGVNNRHDRHPNVGR